MSKTVRCHFPRLLVACVLAVAGCRCGAANRSVAVAPASAAAPMRQIEAEVGDAACDAPSQCKTLAIGYKACGGPESYLAYSSKRSDSARLAALAARDAEARMRADAGAGMASTCSVVSDPGAACRAGRCVLQPRGLGGSDAR